MDLTRSPRSQMTRSAPHFMLARAVITSVLLVSLGAHAAPPRFFARPIEGVVHLCDAADPSSVAPVHGAAIANDGRIACVADCGTTAGGARPFVVMPTGEVVAYAHGSFNFARPVGFRHDGSLLMLGDWCPPVSGGCTTAVSITVPASDGEALVLAASADTTSVANDVEETGWAVGWGATSATGAWRVRPEGTFEALAVAGGGAIDAHAVSPSGVAAGSAYINGVLQAVRWNTKGAAAVLPSIKSGLPTEALAVGLDGTVVGTSGGRAVWWQGSGAPIALLPVGSSSKGSSSKGSSSKATAMAGDSTEGHPLGFAIFGTHAGGTRLFRATGPSNWTSLGPFDASAQFFGFEIVDAPQPDLVVAHAHTPLYQRVAFVWTLEGGLHRFDRSIVNLPSGPNPPIEVVAANSSGVVLVNLGASLAPYTLVQLDPGDTNGDGRINAADLALLLATWGPVPAGRRGAADFDGDGDVDAADLGFLLTSWN